MAGAPQTKVSPGSATTSQILLTLDHLTGQFSVGQEGPVIASAQSFYGMLGLAMEQYLKQRLEKQLERERLIAVPRYQ